MLHKSWGAPLEPSREYSSPLEECVKPVEALESASQDFLVGDSVFSPALEHAVEADAFRSLEPRVLHVGVVDHLADPAHRLVLDREPLRQRFKRAIVSVMRELRIEHIKWNRSEERRVGKECRS